MNPAEIKMWNKRTIEESLLAITAFAAREHILLHEIVISKDVFEELKMEKGPLWREDGKFAGAVGLVKVSPQN